MAQLFGRWTVKLPGEEYVFEPDEITVAEEYRLESELGGLSFDQWLTEVDERRASACQTLIWFLRYKAGRVEDRSQVNFPIRRLVLESIEEPDPNSPASGDGSAPADGPATSEATTSQPSLSLSGSAHSNGTA